MQIVLRALVVFAVLFLITRVVGKRQLGQMTAFELVLLITMGDLVQQGVTQEDYSITGALLAVGTFAAASIALSWVTWKYKRARRLIDGHPTVIVREGKILNDVADLERLPVEEILEAMREKGIRDPADVDLGVLEPDGGYSFFTKTGTSPRPGPSPD